MNNKTALATILIFTLIGSLVAGLHTVESVNAENRTITVSGTTSLINAIYGSEDGTTVLIKKGTYVLPKNQILTIGRSVSLIGEDTSNTVIIIHPPYIATGGYHLGNGSIEPDYAYDNPIKITASNVTISGLTIISNPSRNILASGYGTQIVGNNITTGIFVLGTYQNITGNIFPQSGIQCYGSNNIIAQNKIINDSIVVGYSHTSNTLTGNILVGGYGIHLVGDANTATNNVLVNCSVRLIGNNNIASNNTVKSYDEYFAETGLTPAPTITPAQNPTPSPTITPTTTPSVSPTLSPTLTPTPAIPAGHATDYSLVIVIAILVILAVVIVLLVYFSAHVIAVKRKRSKSTLALIFFTLTLILSLAGWFVMASIYGPSIIVVATNETNIEPERYVLLENPDRHTLEAISNGDSTAFDSLDKTNIDELNDANAKQFDYKDFYYKYNNTYYQFAILYGDSFPPFLLPQILLAGIIASIPAIVIICLFKAATYLKRHIQNRSMNGN